MQQPFSGEISMSHDSVTIQSHFFTSAGVIRVAKICFVYSLHFCKDSFLFQWQSLFSGNSWEIKCALAHYWHPFTLPCTLSLWAAIALNAVLALEDASVAMISMSTGPLCQLSIHCPSPSDLLMMPVLEHIHPLCESVDPSNCELAKDSDNGHIKTLGQSHWHASQAVASPSSCTTFSTFLFFLLFLRLSLIGIPHKFAHGDARLIVLPYVPSLDRCTLTSFSLYTHSFFALCRSCSLTGATVVCCVVCSWRLKLLFVHSITNCSPFLFSSFWPFSSSAQPTQRIHSSLRAAFLWSQGTANVDAISTSRRPLLRGALPRGPAESTVQHRLQCSRTILFTTSEAWHTLLCLSPWPGHRGRWR